MDVSWLTRYLLLKWSKFTDYQMMGQAGHTSQIITWNNKQIPQYNMPALRAFGFQCHGPRHTATAPKQSQNYWLPVPSCSSSQVAKKNWTTDPFTKSASFRWWIHKYIANTHNSAIKLSACRHTMPCHSTSLLSFHLPTSQYPTHAP